MQENFGGVLGVSTPTKLGLQEAPQLFGMMSKKMAGDAPDMGMGLGNKPEMGMGKPKPDMGSSSPDDDDDDNDMDDDDLDDDDTDNADGDMDNDDSDDDGDMDDPDGGDPDAGGDDTGMMDMGMGGAGGAGGPPMGKKKPPVGVGDLGGPPMMKKMTGAMHMRKEASDPQDAKMNSQNKKNKANDQSIDKAGTAQKKTTFVKETADVQDSKMKSQNKSDGMEDQNIGEKCCSKCGKMKKSKKCCKMTKEQTEFNNSLRSQLGITGSGELKFTRDELGFWVPVTEDVLVNKQAPQEDNEPQAGDVGFAPQQKLGLSGSSFQEWASYHNKQVKNNK